MQKSDKNSLNSLPIKEEVSSTLRIIEYVVFIFRAAARQRKTLHPALSTLGKRLHILNLGCKQARSLSLSSVGSVSSVGQKKKIKLKWTNRKPSYL